ncbi:MAG: signal peptide peptidase SppA [Pseudomonadota bacterium]
MWGFLRGIGKLFLYTFLAIQAFIGVAVFLLIAGTIIAIQNQGSGDDDVEIPENAALVLNPAGVIVELPPVADEFEDALNEAFGSSSPTYHSIHDVLRVINEAAEDDRITGLVIDLENTGIAGPSKVDQLAEAIADFKATGKTVVAVSDSYGQNQYYLASLAETVIAHPFGGVFPTGFGAYRTYYRELLENLKLTTHIFKVGTYKSAIEPIIRDDMSDEDREQRLGYIQPLWDRLASGVDENRGLNAGTFDGLVQAADQVVVASNGDLAAVGVDNGMIDQLMTRSQQRRFLIETFGAQEDDENAYNGVSYSKYRSSLDAVEDDEDVDNIAVVSVTGAIVDGSADIGEAAGGDTIAAQLRKARFDENVKAVVLRVDSGGGSAYASEIIRQQVLELQDAGKPVVASMGSVAASGGYWVLANADAIYASPTTITGSIGIFGVLQTAENAAEWAGLNVDGVGVAPITEINAAGLGPLPEVAKTIFQSSVESGYRQFLTVVSEGRDLDPDYVDSIAQGRVWIGTDAKELGLVDEFGELDAALDEAARLAEIDEYDVVDFIDRRTAFEKFMEQFGAAAVRAAVGSNVDGRAPSTFGKLVRTVFDEIETLNQYNDPRGVYARCLECDIR